jgi:hypothetical protein
MRWETTCFGTAGGQGPYDDRELLAREGAIGLQSRPTLLRSDKGSCNR